MQNLLRDGPQPQCRAGLPRQAQIVRHHLRFFVRFPYYPQKEGARLDVQSCPFKGLAAANLMPSRESNYLLEHTVLQKIFKLFLAADECKWLP